MNRDSQTRVNVNPVELRHELAILQDIDPTLRPGYYSLVLAACFISDSAGPKTLAK